MISRNNHIDITAERVRVFDTFKDVSVIETGVNQKEILKAKPRRPKIIPAAALSLQTTNFHNKQDSYELVIGNLNPPPPDSDLYKCISGYIEGNTKDSIFHKAITCGREYCKICGADYSITHQRRILRVSHYISQLNTVGYMVITVPEQFREQMKCKKALSDFRTYIRRKLKRGETTTIKARDIKSKKIIKRKFKGVNTERGLIRYHWCGEDGSTWKPHINVLTETGYINPWQLEKLKNETGAWFACYFNYKGEVTPNIYYAYTKDRNKIKHWVNYVTRSTAKFIRDKKIKDLIYNYKNTGYFGQFERKPKKGSEAAEILASRDPETGEKINWTRKIRQAEFNQFYRKKAKYFKAGTWETARELLNPENKIFFPEDKDVYISLGFG